MTNYEKIISELTVEKLAEGMAVWYDGLCGNCPLGWNDICDYRKLCEDNLKLWLESEADDEGDIIQRKTS